MGAPADGDGARTKVLVLGGGPAALAAACELTATEQLRERYEVTVLQIGWRLGGKGASGRNAAQHQRIEEHGLHVWLGCYDNAFALMRRVYAELGRPAGAPLATWQEAFEPCDDVVLYEDWHGRRVGHRLHFPRSPLAPGEERERTLGEMLHEAVGWVAREWEGLREGDPDLHAAAAEAPPLAERHHPRGILHRLVDDLERFAGGAETEAIRAGGALLHGFRDWLWAHVVQRRVDDDRLRFLFGAVDLIGTMATGLAADRVVEDGFGALNEQELRPWLARHGATELTLRTSPVLRGVYDGAFAYEDGDKARPNTAAGKGIQDVIRTVFLYKGAIAWKHAAGTGDTVFGPIHDVLRRRGVDVRFFNAVTRLRVPPGGEAVQEIDVVVQAHVNGGGPYDPLVDVKGLGCWPSAPSFDQLEEGERLRATGADLEHDADPLGVGPTTLRRGVDFDVVVLGLPPDVQREVAADLVREDPGYAAMLEHTRTVVTQACQLWLDREPAGEHGLGRPRSEPVRSGCGEPLDRYCDMSHLIAREAWPAAGDTLDVAYFGGVIPTQGLTSKEQADAQARANAIAFLDADARDFWPDGECARARRLEWSLLVDPDGGEGAQRFDSQYWRANFQPSERYVLTPAGTVAYRLLADQTRFVNLLLAGDWTRNGLDAGCVEAAVTSGMLAAQALSGFPEHIAGVKGWLSRDAFQPVGPKRSVRTTSEG